MKYHLSYDNFLEMLEKQTALLAKLCQQFDEGNYEYADVISTKIAAIINFRGKKESLLPNMEKQETMLFYSTSKVLDTYENVLLYRSLVATTIKDGQLIYHPKLDQGKYPKTLHPFSVWASSPVYIVNLEKNTQNMDGLIYIGELNESTQFIMSREKIINFYRNKFSGAHFDTKLDQNIYQAAIGLSSIEHADNPNLKNVPGEKYVPGEPIKYMLEMAVRQIAHELLLTLKKEFSFKLDYKPTLLDFSGKKTKGLPDHLVKIVVENEVGEKKIKVVQI
ncbi:MAG: hypothetical protein GX662_11160 [Trichococcus flocculiformis]|uniref:Uncharacterized protein n=1 Tax=Trichococcus flocculiformis TaxID=82803 RepID=A0A847D7Y7_9LACT|nr:hypothetical protein [Trichococcus flocculiformis]NLD32795.1 hypothetical protein [Trichococcus flocculiformis]